MKVLWELFITFARIGGFTFGGGYAMLPMIQKEVVEQKKWATVEEVLDYYAIGQSTPGIIAVNTATFIGYKIKGLSGAIVATTGVVFPSVVIITIIAAFFARFQEYAVVQQAFGGIRVAVTVLVLNAVIRMWKKSVKDRLGIAIFTVTFILMAFTKISPIAVIVTSAALGITFTRRRAVK
jgi:chromate transporter